MGESAVCLRRSFSQPVHSSPQDTEGDPVCALTGSISFGRYMSESLAWEKWSTFSHNRYLEEVEKFSKPGSVAQMKAFFEDHFKRRAAMRDAEKAKAVTNDLQNTRRASKDTPLCTEPSKASTSDDSQTDDLSAHVGCLSNTSSSDPTSDTNCMLLVKGEMVNKEYKQKKSCDKVDFSNNSSSYSSIFETDSVTTLKGDQEIEGQRDNEENVRDEVEDTKSIEDTKSNGVVVASAGKVVNEFQEKSATLRKPEQVNRLSRSVSHSKGPRPSSQHGSRTSLMQMKSGIGQSSSKKSSAESNNKRISALKSFRASVDLPSSSDEAAKVFPRNLTHTLTTTRAVSRVSKSKISDAVSCNKRPSGEGSNTSKRLMRSCLHLSTSYASSRAESQYQARPIGEAPVGNAIGRKTLAPRSLNRSTNCVSHSGGARKRPPKTPENNSSLAECSTQASVPRVSRQPPNNQLGHKRLHCYVARSVSGSMPVYNGKQTAPVNCAKPLNSDKITSRTSTPFSPFSFRSEERAAKRKEFFKKLEERNKRIEFRNQQRPTRSKVPLTQSQSPKVIQMPFLSSKRNLKTQPLQRPSRNTTDRDKKRQTLTQSDTLLSKKKNHENASPNIPW